MPTTDRNGGSIEPTRATIAQRRKQAILADRAAQIEGIRQASVAHPHLRETMEIIEKGIAFHGTYNIAQAEIEHMLDTIRATLVTDYHSRLQRDPKNLEIAALDDDHATAFTESFDDRSGLVSVSDAVLSLSTYLAQLLAFWLNPTGRFLLKMHARILKASRSNWSGDHESFVVTALLRYYIQHQRVHGVAAKVGVSLSPRGREWAEVLSTASDLFVIAHEAAHFALGHEELPATRENEEQAKLLEFEADAFGVELLQRTLERLGIPAALDVARFGANLGLYAIDITERSLFVRRPRTHPRATERWSRLEILYPSKGDLAQRHLLRALDLAAERAVNINDPLPPEVWAATWKHPAVNPIHNAEYLSMQTYVDQIQGKDPRLIKLLLDKVRADGGPDLASGLNRAYLGAEAVLQEWGVSARLQKELLDSGGGLTFYRLHEAIRKAAVMREGKPPPFGNYLLAITAACAVQKLFREMELGGTHG